MSHRVLLALAATLVGCGGPAEAPASPEATHEAAPAAAEATPEAPAASPAPTLMLSQAQFTIEGGKPVPGPAKLVLLRKSGDGWEPSLLEDPESNVFHKATPWRGGILTIGAMGAKIRHWTPSGGAWAPTTLWERSWGGRFDRMRDLEIGDVDGDGQEELVVATHDQGVVAVGDEVDGKWSFVELDQTPDTFVHEVEIGDVDGDGKKEFYVTPSERNRASLESQPGGVARYDLVDGKYVRTMVVQWTESHAKEILVADLDADGRDELYAVREGHTRKNEAGKNELLDPVRVSRLVPKEGGGWEEVVVAAIEDHQTRFLVPGDVDGDGKTDLVAAGFKSGLYVLRRQQDGSFVVDKIDPESSGFEHATHVADLDGDGKLEIYVAADDQRELRRYTWNGESFERTRIAAIPERHITWNVSSGTF